MSDAEFLDENGPTGTQEFHPSMHGAPAGGAGGGGLIWDPISKTYVPHDEKQQPARFQVPGTPDPGDINFQEKTKNPQFDGSVFSRYAATRMVRLSPEPEDDFGVYSDRTRGPYNTPLVFRGTFDECRQWLREEGRYASVVYASDDELAQAQQYRDAANDFAAQAERAPNVARREWLLEKSNYYRVLADQLTGDSPDRAPNGAPDAQSLGDVYQDVVPKRNPGMTDDTFPSSISSHTPKVISMPTTDRFNNHDRITLGSDEANLRDCPNECGGLMGDHEGESMCHTCGHKEKIHYAGFLAPLLAPAAEAVGGSAIADAVGGSAIKAVAPLMGRVMGGGMDAASGGAASTPQTGGGSAVADEDMRTAGYGDEPGEYLSEGPWDGYPSWQYSGDPHVDLGVAEEKLMAGECTQAEFNALLERAQRTNVDDPYDADPPYSDSNYDDGGEGDEPYARHGSSITEESDGFGNENSGVDSLPDSGNKGSEGQDRAADELDTDTDGAGGSQAKDALQLYKAVEPYLESIADNDDSHEDPIAKGIHEMFLKIDPNYLSADSLEKAARLEFSKIAGGTCPTCHIDLTTAQQCGGATNITCPVGLPHPGGAQVPVNPASLGQPVGQPLVASVHEAKPKMCPVHEQMVNYALTLQDPAAAVQALSGQLFGEHSCQGGWTGENKNGNPYKCRYKPEMITQAYWDEKNEAAEQRKLEREQQQALMAEQQEQMMPPTELDSPEPAPVPEPEGVLVGGPAFEEQQAEQAHGPVVQDIPALDPLQTPDDYIPAEQGAEVIQFPQQQAPQFQQQVAASFKWSGPKLSLLGIGEDGPSASPEEMFQDTPPEEQPAAATEGLISEGPTDTDGNPIEVGQTYEVTSSNSDDVIPDRYTITGKDPNGNFIQFDVEPQPGQPFGFTNTLSTLQIKTQGLNFAPASDDANARGEVNSDQDNTKGSDDPTSVTDLDTGGNSHASKTADNAQQHWDNAVSDRKWDTTDPNACPMCEGRGCDNCGGTGRTDEVQGHMPVDAPLKQYSSEKTAIHGIGEGDNSFLAPGNHSDYQGGDSDVGFMEGINADHGMNQIADLPALVRVKEMLLGTGHDEREVNQILQSLVEETRSERGRAELANPTGEEYGLDEEDMNGMQIEHAAKLEGNPSLDWLNDDDTPQQKTAGKDYSLGEQRGFVNETGSARNLDKLDLSGTHYPTSVDEDPYSNFLW